jgi:hypothetical protein
VLRALRSDVRAVAFAAQANVPRAQDTRSMSGAAAVAERQAPNPRCLTQPGPDE